MLGLAALCLAVGGCSSNYTGPRLPSVEHALAFDRQGNPTDPTGNIDCQEGELLCNGRFTSRRRSRDLESAEYRALRKRVIDSILEEAGDQRKILIFIHGGLNSRKGGLKRAAQLQQVIRDESDFYPLFVLWRSSLKSSYLDHVFFVRQGKYHRNATVLLAPAYFLTDIVRGVARAPVVWASGLKNAYRARKNSKPRSLTRQTAAILSGEEELFWEHDERCPQAGVDQARRYAALAVTLPTTKAVTAPLIDAFGTSSWDVMLRRTDTLFYRDDYYREDFVPREPPDREHNPSGGLALFLEDLSTALEGREGWEITLVGHSMGGIVVNHVVRHFGGRLPIRNLVYMAAANTLREYEETVIPHLRRQVAAERAGTPGVRTDVYHIAIHRKAEVRERPAYDLPPRGSLLVWLDDFLAAPRVTVDRTAGRINNLLRVAAIPGREDIKDRIHYKAYGVGRCLREEHPQKHGAFSSTYRFWESDCWQPATKDYPTSAGRSCYVPEGWDGYDYPADPGRP